MVRVYNTLRNRFRCLSPTLCHKRPNLWIRTTSTEYTMRTQALHGYHSTQCAREKTHCHDTKPLSGAVNKNSEIIVHHTTKRRETKKTKTMCKEQNNKKTFSENPTGIVYNLYAPIEDMNSHVVLNEARAHKKFLSMHKNLFNYLSICLSSIDRHYMFDSFIHPCIGQRAIESKLLLNLIFLITIILGSNGLLIAETREQNGKSSDCQGGDPNRHYHYVKVQQTFCTFFTTVAKMSH